MSCQMSGVCPVQTLSATQRTLLATPCVKVQRVKACVEEAGAPTLDARADATMLSPLPAAPALTDGSRQQRAPGVRTAPAPHPPWLQMMDVHTELRPDRFLVITENLVCRPYLVGSFSFSLSVSNYFHLIAKK